MDVEYISLHKGIRNTPSNTEHLAERQLRADKSLTIRKEYIVPHKAQKDKRRKRKRGGE